MRRRNRAALAAAGLAALLPAGIPSARAADLTWAPESADAWTWDAGTTAAWKDGTGQKTFTNGDKAVFDSTETQAPENRTVAVDLGEAGPSVLAFSGGNDYVFDGGAIAVGTELTLGGTGAVTFKNAVSTPKTTLTSGTLGFVDAFDAGTFSAAGGGTVKAAGTGVSVFTFSVPEGAESAVQCGWDKSAGNGISVRKKGAGKATLNVKKLFDALGGAANGRIYVDEGTLSGTGYDFYQNPGEMIYEVSNNATLTSTGAHALGGYAGGIRVFLHPGATFSPVAGQYMGQINPGLWLQGNATVRGDIRNEGKFYVKAEGTGNFIENLNKQYGNQLYIEVAGAGDELYVANLECNQTVTKTGAGMLLVGNPTRFEAGKALTVSAGTLAATNGFTSLSSPAAVAVADGAAFTNAGPGIFWLSDTASSSTGSGAFRGVFGSQSAVQDFSKGLTVRGGFYIRGDGFRADYAGLTVDGYVGIDHGSAAPFAFPAGLVYAEGTVMRVTAGAAAPANITGTAFPKRLELAPGSCAYVDVLNGGPAADCTAAGATFSQDATVRLALGDSMIPAGTYPVFTGISALPDVRPQIAGHLAAVERAEWVIQDNALAVKITVTGEVGTLTWRPAAAGESAEWSGEAANWTNAAGQAAAFANGSGAVFDGAEPNAVGTVTVAEGQIPGAVVFSGNRDYVLAGAKLGGGSAFVKGGAGTLTIDGGGLAAQPVTVSGGVLKLGANAAAGALGNAAVPVTIESGGAFDVNYTAENGNDFDRSELTHGKIFRIAGAGADGRGALVNNGPHESQRTFSKIELTGDATIGGSNRVDTRVLDNSAAIQERPLITGPGHTLTVKNAKLFGVVNTDVDVEKIIVSDGGVLGPEGDTSITAPGGIELAGGALKPYDLKREFALPVTAVSGDNSIQSAAGTAAFTGPVTVQDGAVLDLSGSVSAFKGPVTNNGTLRVTGGDQRFLGPVWSADPIELSGGQLNWGYGAGSSWPTLENNRTITLNGGDFRLIPPGPRAEGDLTLTGGNGQVWFLGSAAADVLTLTNTEIRTAGGIHLGNPSNYGMVTFGEGARIDAGSLGLGEGNPNPKSTQARLLPGSELHVTGQTRFGHWSGGAIEYQHELAVDGGSFVNTDKITVIGWHSANASLLLNGGVMDVKGIKLRQDARGGMSGNLNPKNTSEHFVMSGGLLKMGDSGIQANGYFSANGSGAYLNGGAMTNTADWGATPYATVAFAGGAFTWDLGGNLVNFNTALQGDGDVTLRGNAAFNDGGVHALGTVRGRWTIANAGKTSLKNAAAFTAGLTLEEGASATVDIRDAGYVRFGANQNTEIQDVETWILSDEMAFIHTAKSASSSTYVYAGEFFVPEGMAGTWTFAESFDDELYLTVDGTKVLNDTVWNATTTKQIELAAGWHAFRLVGYNGNSGGGPQADDWKSRQMGVGWTNAAVTVKAASAYTHFSPDTLEMRPGAATADERLRLAGNSLYWSHHQGTADNWKTIADWNTTVVTNSIKAISTKSTWQPGSLSVNRFRGWFLVEAEQAGSWKFWGSYDDRCALWIDGFDAELDGNNIKNARRAFDLAPGWHRFELRIYDSGGAWGPWNPGEGAALQYQINGAGDWHAFDEDGLAFRASLASPNTEYGFIGGELELKAGSKLSNASAGGPCAITGTLKGAGTIEGPFAFATNAVWALEGTASGLTGVVSFGEDAYPQALAGLRKVRVAFSGRPASFRYEVCDALGLEGKTAEELAGIEIEASDADGKAYPFHAAVSGGKFVLVNDAPPGTILILR